MPTTSYGQDGEEGHIGNQEQRQRNKRQCALILLGIAILVGGGLILFFINHLKKENAIDHELRHTGAPSNFTNA
ncbi:MAG: hypothetical protein OEY79_04345, partial [Anaplasmataceae bacterium]|nr:hypothetical protein [Anaplasmataceae bacterium]